MFLSKKWILILIGLTGLSFMILLVIQFGWVRRSMALKRQQQDLNIRENSIRIRLGVLGDKSFQLAYLAKPGERFDFVAASSDKGLGMTLKHKIDSILERSGSPLSANVYTRTGSYCYLMDYVPPGERNDNIDHSQYKICLCNNSAPLRLDVGFNLMPAASSFDAGAAALVWPSVILILLLITLFTYAIYIINRQKKLAELKNDFINNLTHEFNTPLFSIGITGNLLLRSEAVQQSPKLGEYVRLIQTEKERIQTQVDKILQLSALEASDVPLEKENVAMHPLISDCMQSFRHAIEEKGGRIRFAPGAAFDKVKGDRLHLSNAINNLFDNAIKYSESPPVVSVTTSNEERDLVIRVTDNGIGISPAHRKMIFEKFYRVKHGDRHDVKGFGLGLSYVKKIVDLHHGSVDVEPGPAKGSVFIIRLPYLSDQ